MCTVTVIPIRDEAGPGLRLVSNRDELRTRTPATPPVEHEIEAGLGVWPVDPSGGGTWIGASTHGVVLSLLNLNLDPHPAPPNRALSRGGVIPAVIGATDAKEAARRVMGLELERMNCFRLVCADAGRLLCARWDRSALTIEERPLVPVCFASSGLGDHLVQERLPLWREMVEERGAAPETQDAFHAHRWPDRGYASVLMEREEARTTSTTVCEVRGDRIVVAHRDDGGWREQVEIVRSKRTTRAVAPR